MIDTAKLTAAHTPGPWHASNVRTTGPFPGCDIGAADCRNVAMVHYDAISREDAAETLANARLIAAAPDLLAALRMLCDRFDTFDGEPYNNPPDSPWAIARAAIASATGEG